MALGQQEGERLIAPRLVWRQSCPATAAEVVDAVRHVPLKLTMAAAGNARPTVGVPAEPCLQ